MLGLSHPDQYGHDVNVLMRSASLFSSQSSCFVLNPTSVVFNGRSFNGDAVEKWQANGQGGNDTFTVNGGAGALRTGSGTSAARCA